MELWVGAVIFGFLYAFMTMGCFITFRIHHFPDVTVDGSFTTGAAISAILISSGWSSLLTFGFAFLAGAAAGSITAFINTRLNINGLLAGILVMTGLYSINLHVMGRSNIPLYQHGTFITWLERINPGLPSEAWVLVSLIPVMLVFWLAVTLFFKTDAGIASIASGNNPTMAAAMGINVDRTKILAVAVANGLTGLSGGIVAQYQGFADVGMGVGTVVTGLAAVIIGESLIPSRSIQARIFGVILGSVIFRLLIALALAAGVNAIDLKLLTAVFVLGALILPKLLSWWRAQGDALSKIARTAAASPWPVKIFGVVIAAGIVFAWGAHFFSARSLNPATERPSSEIVSRSDSPAGQTGIASDHESPTPNLGASSPKPAKRLVIYHFTDSATVMEGFKGFMEELEQDSFLEHYRIKVERKSAQSDWNLAQAIAEDIVRQKFDFIVTFTTPVLQMMARANRDIPHVFGLVTNPYPTGGNGEESGRRANRTGIATLPPMDSTVATMRELFPKASRIGIVWNPSDAAAETCVQMARKAAAAQHFELIETTVGNTGEVMDAVKSLTSRGIDLFLSSQDGVVNLAAPTIAAILRQRRIPYFSNSPAQVDQGAFIAIGGDWEEIGRETARLTKRVIAGEDPKTIPISYSTIEKIAINLGLAKEYGIELPEALIARAAYIKR